MEYINSLDLALVILSRHVNWKINRCRRDEVILKLQIILVDVLHLKATVTLGLIVLNIAGALGLQFAGTAEPSAQEGDESDQEPDVAKESQRKLSGVQDYVAVAVDDHDEERGEEREHPNSGPEMKLFSSEPLANAETNQRDQSDSAVGQS